MKKSILIVVFFLTGTAFSQSLITTIYGDTEYSTSEAQTTITAIFNVGYDRQQIAELYDYAHVFVFLNGNLLSSNPQPSGENYLPADVIVPLYYNYARGLDQEYDIMISIYVSDPVYGWRHMGDRHRFVWIRGSYVATFNLHASSPSGAAVRVDDTWYTTPAYNVPSSGGGEVWEAIPVYKGKSFSRWSDGETLRVRSAPLRNKSSVYAIYEGL